MNRKDFDFYQHVYEILKERFRPSFIPYHEVYSYLGKRFSMKKWMVRELMKSMEDNGYLKMKKRGVLVNPQAKGRTKTGSAS
jgi:hypothetical protein